MHLQLTAQDFMQALESSEGCTAEVLSPSFLLRKVQYIPHTWFFFFYFSLFFKTMHHLKERGLDSEGPQDCVTPNRRHWWITILDTQAT